MSLRTLQHFSGPRPHLVLLLALLGSPCATAADAPPANPGPLPLLANAEAWKRLPPAEKGTGQPLPAWARTLAAPLPWTTAAMLELDFQQRARGTLDPKLRAKLRWTVAQANGCALSQATAAADLLRAGGKAADLRALAGTHDDLPEPERAALAFARKLVVSTASVSDAEAARLVKLHGERQVVAMVLLVAHAGFQDRLLLTLGVREETGASLPPLDVSFKRPRLGARLAAPRPRVVTRPLDTLLQPKLDRDWAALDSSALGKELVKAQSRRPRITLPSGQDLAIHWGEVCRAHQPELANAWAACMRTFGAEASQDPVFETSVFWVVTRARQSFY